jgi:hypothetical protein
LFIFIIDHKTNTNSLKDEFMKAEKITACLLGLLILTSFGFKGSDEPTVNDPSDWEAGGKSLLIIF